MPRRLTELFSLAFLAALISGAASAAAAPALPASVATSARLQALARDMTFVWARQHPIVATELGITEEDGNLNIPSTAERARDLAEIRTWEARLAAIPVANASLVDRDDARLLRAQLTTLERNLTVYNVDQKDYSGPANAIVGVIFEQFLHMPIPGTAGATNADRALAWDRIVARLRKAPAYVEAGQRQVIHPGHLFAVVGMLELEGSPDFLSGALTDAAKAQLPASKFAAFASARDALLVTLKATTAYLKAHVAGWPENFAMGRTAYDAMLRDEQLLPYATDDVVRMGYDELGHGWAQQEWLENDAKVRGTPLGAPSGGGMAPSGEALIPYYRSRIAELIAFMKSHDVITIPAWLGTVQVVETPKFLQPVQPGESMDAPRLFSKETTGFYFITPPTSLAAAAKRLDLYQDFDRDRIWSTAAHEVMPGHYLQLSIARRNPDFVRKIQSSGVFAEGWAYYGESMFVELGLYGNDLDGRLDVAQWERIRGARAIVDARLASGEWNYRRAADFFARETGALQSQADAAVAGIALGPGYVISYTVGRLQLEQLIDEYRHRTGARGSMHDFHDRLMCYGSTPFAVIGPELLADLAKPVAAVRAAAHY